MRQFLPLIFITLHFFPFQLNLATGGVAEAVVVVAAEVTGAAETGEVLVTDGVDTTVTVLQARRTHSHSNSRIRDLP